ncbi:MAG: TIGR01777 family protein [Armatimonadetes bacterium]|nr:TIGR01777 family protein [Armatimonadota bacterium]
MNKKVVICGGSGLIGQALDKRLTDSGYDVVTVSRHPKLGEISWDDLGRAIDGATAVINLSGRPIACKFTESNKREILNSRVESTQKVAKAFATCTNPPAKWINASAVGFYGNRGDETMTEASSPGSGFVVDVCRAWEDACLKSEANCAKTVLRIGVVLTSNGGAMSKLMPLTKAFLGGAVGNGLQWMSWIALKDLVRLFEWVIENDAPSVVNACAPEPIRNGDFMAWLRRQLRRPWSPPVPAFMMKLLGQTVGPDASLLLDSTRAIPTQTGDFQFMVPSLENARLDDLSVPS